MTDLILKFLLFGLLDQRGHTYKYMYTYNTHTQKDGDLLQRFCMSSQGKLTEFFIDE